MKTLAVFCDGTWQHLDQRYPTNVAKLARAVLPSGPDGPQIVYYDDGVGVGEGVANLAVHLVGGALGQGLDYKIARAYEFLCLNYEPGDRIFLFGFSRGAYTARSLAGLLRLVWILRREHANRVFDATAIYRNRPRQDPYPADFQAQVDKFKADHCYPSAPFVDPKAYTPGELESLQPANDCAWLQYVGVWDTVGSLGVPQNLPFAQQLDDKYQFYDLRLSRFVRSARHAMAIDERRDNFAPSPWSNISDLNQNAGANGVAYADRPYQQQWFPGGHGSVGGGGDDGGLSLVPMLWIAEGAARAGLQLDLQELKSYESVAHPDAKFEAGAFSLGEFVLKLNGMHDRTGPDTFDEVSLSARIRWARVASYRPNPLSNHPAVKAALDQFEPGADPQVYFAP